MFAIVALEAEAAGFIKRSTLLLVLALLLVAGGLTLIRPSLFSKQCLLLFGPDTNLAVTVELRDNQLLLHHGRSLGSHPKRYPLDNQPFPATAAPQLLDTNRGIRYTITSAFRCQSTGPLSGESLLISVKIDEGDDVSYEQYADAQLRPGWKSSAIAHFHGPLTIGPQTASWQIPSYVRLVRGGKTNDLRSYIGTMDPATACWTVVKVHSDTNSLFPEDIFPYADIEFPPREPHQLSIKERFPLQEFC